VSVSVCVCVFKIIGCLDDERQNKGLADVGKSANFVCTKIFLHNSFPFLSFPCQEFHICFSQDFAALLFS
jgi:hypothetical protein